MSDAADLSNHIKALAMAIYALADTLIERGAIEPGDLPAQLRRFDSPADGLNAIVEAMASNLESRHFKSVARRGLRLVEGEPGGEA